LIEAARLEPQHPSVLLLELARAGVFRLVVVEQVEREARRVLGADLDRLLENCLVERWPDPPAAVTAQAYPVLCPHMRHGNDVPVAVALLDARPDAFVSSNREHWRPSLRDVLGGVRVMTPRRILGELGEPAPPRQTRRTL
jgi:xanthine/CO dehydrogenase XdhC/CoxF family maturation factor